jgi:UDP-perosamine 4-acetyltransferase
MPLDNMSDLILWGAGGHGKVVVDIARSTGLFRSIAFLDDDRSKTGATIYGCPVLGGPEILGQLAGRCFAITIGDNRTRAHCYARARFMGLKPVALIDERAMVSPSAVIGPGTVVAPGAAIKADAVIGENCIINSLASVGHDCRLASHIHIAPGVSLGGGVTVGSYAFVATGAVALPQADIGEGAIVGAGAVVLRSAPAHSMVLGVPAKVVAPRLRAREVAG